VRIVPNPFARETTIQLALDPARPVRVTVLDAAGRVVRALPASATVRWDGTRDSGERALPGIYWLRVNWAGGADTRRLIKLR
jgi:flagellar hook assembly protein FlgD